MPDTNTKKGDKIELGRFTRDGAEENPILWTVLEVSENSALILCDWLVADLPYNNEEGEIEWKDCSLREWLNREFIFSAFWPDEIERIKETVLSEEQDVVDRLFILSKQEVEKYLSDEADRSPDGILFIPTRAALKAGFSEAECDEYWWLRNTAGFDSRFGCMIQHIDHNGFFGKTPSYCERWVRPACRVVLDQ